MMFEDSPRDSSIGNDGQLVNDAVVIACGLATTALVAVVLAYVRSHWDWAVYGWRLFGFIPLAAFFCGYLAASGYYLAARLRGCKPSGALFICIGVAAIGAYFLLHYLSYSGLAEAGKLAPDRMSFGRYLQTANDTSVLDVRHSPAMLDGNYRPKAYSIVWGVLEILLFAVAGWTLFGPGELKTDGSVVDQVAA